MYTTMEMELIMKLYDYMSEEDKLDWTPKNAEEMYNDELMLSEQRGYECQIESAEVLFETINELIQQDIEDDEL